MGLKCLPDIAQSIKENNLSGIDGAGIYIDDIGVFSKDWNHHNGLSLIYENANGLSKKLTSLDIVLHHETLSLGKGK
ncbi:hypothetical protein ACHAW6_001043 [Cyclotella cf. meneghiniana]